MPKLQSSLPPNRNSFTDQIGHKANRKLRARQTRKDVWFALGMFGMVGWAVAVPSILGVALGVWIDRQISSQYSWTLMLLLVGIFLGCLNAWHWVKKESHHN